MELKHLTLKPCLTKKPPITELFNVKLKTFKKCLKNDISK